MARSASALRISEQSENIDIEQFIRGTYTDEIVIGLCGPIGTDISFVGKRIEKILETEYGYECKRITLSDFIKKHFKDIDFESLKKKPFNYYNALIDKGNELRKVHSTSILASFAINEITIKREEQRLAVGGEFKSRRQCYIVDSIKHIDELELLRLIYRELFYFIGIFSTLEIRKKTLTDKAMKSSEAYQLIDRDYSEEFTAGQKVGKIFVEADFFLRLDKSTHNTVDFKVKRYLDLIFNSNIVTPTIHESAMYVAASSAGNSACLSRQVGASITDEKGDILSVGWNDVPQYGGGVYQFKTEDPTSEKDFRCMNLQGGICFNDKEKNDIIELVVNELIDLGIVDNKEKLKLKAVISKSKIGGIIEFSRAVHAEMLAIIQGSQHAGMKMRNGRLYCTTYPCHNCARHIVAAGIKEVFYIEPYPKSLAVKLHYDSLTEDESKEGFVKILVYEGVSPKRYYEFFRMSGDSRKIDGKRPNFSTLKQKPKKTSTLQAIPILEKAVTKDLLNRNLI